MKYIKNFKGQELEDCYSDIRDNGVAYECYVYLYGNGEIYYAYLVPLQ